MYPPGLICMLDIGWFSGIGCNLSSDNFGFSFLEEIKRNVCVYIHVTYIYIYIYIYTCHFTTLMCISFIPQNLSCIIKHFKRKHWWARAPFPYATIPNGLWLGHRRPPPGPAAGSATVNPGAIAGVINKSSITCLVVVVCYFNTPFVPRLQSLSVSAINSATDAGTAY